MSTGAPSERTCSCVVEGPCASFSFWFPTSDSEVRVIEFGRPFSYTAAFSGGISTWAYLLVSSEGTMVSMTRERVHSKSRELTTMLVGQVQSKHS